MAGPSASRRVLPAENRSGGRAASTADNRDVPPDARTLAAGLVGRTVTTVSGRTNVVLAIDGDDVIVGTERTPEGARVPLAMIEAGIDALSRDGTVTVDVETLGHRSAFVAAMLLTLPDTTLEPTTPPRILLASTRERYRREQAGEINAWWSEDDGERYWLEITDRPDIGVDLHAPQRDAGGRRTAGYSLLWWVERGDIVFHYDLNLRAITAWSRAVGEIAEAPVVWLSHRGATRRRLGVARAQPGWWLDLDGPYPLPTALTLAGLRERAETVRAAQAALENQHPRQSLYFPFFFYGGTELRPMQPYLNKLPAALVDALTELAAALPELPPADTTAPAPTQPAQITPPAPAGADGLGTPYRRAHARQLPDEREPFAVDPAVVERGLTGHVTTQNGLADALLARGITPRSPRGDEPNFDLAWQDNDIVYVAEVKSITDANEERQLRLGLGQVLRYRHLLGRTHPQVRGVLAAERAPRDATWQELCAALGIALVAGPNFEGHTAITGAPRG